MVKRPNRPERRKPKQEAYRLAHRVILDTPALDAESPGGTAAPPSSMSTSENPTEPDPVLDSRALPVATPVKQITVRLKAFCNGAKNKARNVSGFLCRLALLLWDWVGKNWKLDSIISIGTFGGAFGMIRLGEYLVSVTLLTVSGFAAISRVWHTQKQLKVWIKWITTTLICGVVLTFAIITNRIRGDAPWSNLVKSSVSVSITSDIVANVHLRSMWLPSGSTGVYKPLFQDLFHDWTIRVTPTRTASQVVISIRDARKPVDTIRVSPSENAVVSGPKPNWFSGFEEPSQAPESYIRTVSFSTLNKPATITIRRPIRSRAGVNTITSLDLDLDRQVRASAENCKVVLIPPSIATDARFLHIIDQLKALVAQTVSGSGFTTRLNPDEPYPPLAINESEMIQEIKCTNYPCTKMLLDMKEHTRIR